MAQIEEQNGQVQAIEKLCVFIRQNCRSGESMSLPDLSRRAGISAFHLQRTFTRIVGVSPRRYVQACRMEALKASLQQQSPVTDAIYDSGFNSSSRVYERVNSDLGMTPAVYRAHGKGLEISFVVVDSSLGSLLIAATDRGLCSVQFGDNSTSLEARLHSEFKGAHLNRLVPPYSPLFVASIEALQRYLQGQSWSLDLPTDIRATAFQAKVWNYLQAIPAGEVRTYAEVAIAIGHSKAVRAVAHACASNKLALVVPCHRVIRSDGNLGGYRWGIHRKERLLAEESRMSRGGVVA